jgi:hypothetical protein
MAEQEQNFANHARFVPPYHYVAFPILLVNLLYRLYWLSGGLTFDAILDVLVGVALIIVALFARVFALGAQDRVIRLEMRLRMRELLPDDLQGRINDFTPTQMVGLRFTTTTPCRCSHAVKVRLPVLDCLLDGRRFDDVLVQYLACQGW